MVGGGGDGLWHSESECIALCAQGQPQPEGNHSQRATTRVAPTTSARAQNHEAHPTARPYLTIPACDWYNFFMLTTRRVLETFKQIGVTHVVGLPDNATAALFHALADDPDIYLITVTREGEAFATAAGLWIGGQKPLVVIQNTGLLESGDALRGTLTRMRLPIVLLVSYRGYKSLPNPPPSPLTPDDLSRRDVDSVALLLEPTLRAWAIPYDLVLDNADLPKVPAAQRAADQGQRPIAVVLADTIR